MERPVAPLAQYSPGAQIKAVFHCFLHRNFVLFTYVLHYWDLQKLSTIYKLILKKSVGFYIILSYWHEGGAKGLYIWKKMTVGVQPLLIFPIYFPSCLRLLSSSNSSIADKGSCPEASSNATGSLTISAT